jgi:hypothetical protein
MAAPRGANDPYAIYIILCFSRNQSSLWVIFAPTARRRGHMSLWH